MQGKKVIAVKFKKKTKTTHNNKHCRQMKGFPWTVTAFAIGKVNDKERLHDLHVTSRNT